MKRLKNILFLADYCQQTDNRLLFLCLLKSLLAVLQPFLLLATTARIIDLLLQQSTLALYLRQVALSFSLLLLFSAAQLVINYHYQIRINLSYTTCGDRFTRDYLKMDYPLFESQKIRDSQKELAAYFYVGSLISELFEPLFTALFSILIYGVVLLQLSYWLLGVLTILILLRYPLLQKAAKLLYAKKQYEAREQRQQDYLFRASTHISWAKEIKINRSGQLLQQKFSEQNQRLAAWNKKVTKRFTKLHLAETLLEAILFALQYGYCIWQAYLRRITLGELTLALGAVTAYAQAIGAMVEKVAALAVAAQAVTRYQDYLSDITPAYKKQLPFTAETLAIRFENVSFKYSNAESYTLKKLNLTIAAGERLALVGYNGAGKSTIIKLLCGLYQPTDGTIYFNEQDISQLKPSARQQHVATLLQNFQLFALPLWQNLSLTDEFDEAAGIAALKKSQIYDRICQLPNGLQQELTKHLTDDGIEFSGGEAQKIATARTFYRTHLAILMDEPTSALDPLAEAAQFECFDQLLRQKTALYITHRLAAGRFCDKIAVLDQGQLLAVGTHENLLQTCPLYSELFTKQAYYYQEEARGNDETAST